MLLPFRYNSLKNIENLIKIRFVVQREDKQTDKKAEAENDFVLCCVKIVCTLTILYARNVTDIKILQQKE